MIDNDFVRRKIDKTSFFKNRSSDILVVQIYVDYIIFGATNELLCKQFANLMSDELEMNMMGELNFFLGSQIKQTTNGIFIH